MKVRVAAAQFRQLKAGQVEYQRCMRKASMEEKTAIDEILHMLDSQISNETILKMSSDDLSSPMYFNGVSVGGTDNKII